MKSLVVAPIILAFLAVVGAFPLGFAVHSTPFNGRFTATATMVSQTMTSVTGQGNFEHLGKMAFSSASTVTGEASNCQGFVGTEQVTLTAANGDKVFISSKDVFCATSSFDATPFTSQLTASFTITGGTGRFAVASGSGSGLALCSSSSATSPTSTCSATFTGTITY